MADAGSWRKTERQPTPTERWSTICKSSADCVKLEYDGQGLQAGNGSTWYSYKILHNDEHIGDFHVHPKGPQRVPGNVHLFTGSRAGFTGIAGRAADNRWLLDKRDVKL